MMLTEYFRPLPDVTATHRAAEAGSTTTVTTADAPGLFLKVSPLDPRAGKPRWHACIFFLYVSMYANIPHPFWFS